MPSALGSRGWESLDVGSRLLATAEAACETSPNFFVSCLNPHNKGHAHAVFPGWDALYGMSLDLLPDFRQEMMVQMLFLVEAGPKSMAGISQAAWVLRPLWDA